MVNVMRTAWAPLVHWCLGVKSGAWIKQNGHNNVWYSPTNLGMHWRDFDSWWSTILAAVLECHWKIGITACMAQEIHPVKGIRSFGAVLAFPQALKVQRWGQRMQGNLRLPQNIPWLSQRVFLGSARSVCSMFDYVPYMMANKCDFDCERRLQVCYIMIEFRCKAKLQHLYCILTCWTTENSKPWAEKTLVISHSAKQMEAFHYCMPANS